MKEPIYYYSKKDFLQRIKKAKSPEQQEELADILCATLDYHRKIMLDKGNREGQLSIINPIKQALEITED